MNNKIVKATVIDIADFGIFCNVEMNNEQYKGLIHISQISDQFVRNISDFVNIGDEVEALVLEVNEDKKQVKLSIKQVAN